MNTKPVNKHIFRKIFKSSNGEILFSFSETSGIWELSELYFLLTLNKSVLIKVQQNGLLMLTKSYKLCGKY